MTGVSRRVLGMRRLAALTGALLLLSGCGQRGDTGTPDTGTPPLASTAGTPGDLAPAGSAPADDAPPAAVIAWIEAGNPVRATDFQTVIRDGVTKTLQPGEVAFRPPGPLAPRALAGCIRRWEPRLSCLPALHDAPQRPTDLPGQWIANWVDFDGATVSVGSVHGDPGVFNDGAGLPLAYGDTLKFGDYQCRSDPAGLYCANTAYRTVIRLSDTVTVLGCSRQATPPYRIGAQYYCD